MEVNETPRMPRVLHNEAAEAEVADLMAAEVAHISVVDFVGAAEFMLQQSTGLAISAATHTSTVVE